MAARKLIRNLSVGLIGLEALAIGSFLVIRGDTNSGDPLVYVAIHEGAVRGQAGFSGPRESAFDRADSELAKGVEAAAWDPSKVLYVPADVAWNMEKFLGWNLSVQSSLADLLQLDENDVDAVNHMLNDIVAALQEHELGIVQQIDEREESYFEIPPYAEAAEEIISTALEQAPLAVTPEQKMMLKGVLLHDRSTSGVYTRRIGLAVTNHGPCVYYEIGLEDRFQPTFSSISGNPSAVQFMKQRFGHILTEASYDWIQQQHPEPE